MQSTRTVFPSQSTSGTNASNANDAAQQSAPASAAQHFPIGSWYPSATLSGAQRSSAALCRAAERPPSGGNSPGIDTAPPPQGRDGVSSIAEVEKEQGMVRMFRTLAHHSARLVNFSQAGGKWA